MLPRAVYINDYYRKSRVVTRGNDPAKKSDRRDELMGLLLRQVNILLPCCSSPYQATINVDGGHTGLPFESCSKHKGTYWLRSRGSFRESTLTRIALTACSRIKAAAASTVTAPIP